jgi:hypothetical protein
MHVMLQAVVAYLMCCLQNLQQLSVVGWRGLRHGQGRVSCCSVGCVIFIMTALAQRVQKRLHCLFMAGSSAANIDGQGRVSYGCFAPVTSRYGVCHIVTLLGRTRLFVLCILVQTPFIVLHQMPLCRPIFKNFVVGKGQLPTEGQQVVFDYTAYNESGAVASVTPPPFKACTALTDCSAG